jgi:type VI secretion system protein ImpG
MTDELLPYYNRELAFIRDLGEEFARTHPKIAGRLRWSGHGTEDPHVSRLIEGFAFLAARIRHKLDDDFPELTEALLGILYPHFLVPFPSCAVIQCRLDATQAELTAGYHVPRGSMVETDTLHDLGMPCRFRTSYDTQLWPIRIAAAKYQGKPFAAPPSAANVQAKGVVRLTLQSLSPKVTFNQMPLQNLRFFLPGQDKYVHDLYELLMNRCIGVAVASTPDDPQAVLLSPNVLQPVGFAPEEGLIDYSPRSFLGYRMLQEYFAFPSKYMFCDLTGLTPEILARVGTKNTLEIFVFTDQHLPDLERRVEAGSFRLGCTPMVNLFRQRAEPISWGQTETEYRIVPDARRPTAHEIFSIARVVGTSPANQEIEFSPLYSTLHQDDAEAPRAFWHATRRRARQPAGRVDHGTELFLTLVDLDLQPARLPRWTIHVDTICSNRDYAGRLPFGGGDPPLQFVSGAPLTKIECLTAPTPTYRPTFGHRTMWQLISHLSLNHISLFDQDGTASPLQEILRLYDPTDSRATGNMIEGLTSVTSRRVVGRVNSPTSSGFCRGMEVTLTMDETRFSGGGMFLFATVLERFLAMYTSINSFTKTRLVSSGRPGVVHQWPPRAGEMVLS